VKFAVISLCVYFIQCFCKGHNANENLYSPDTVHPVA